MAKKIALLVRFHRDSPIEGVPFNSNPVFSSSLLERISSGVGATSGVVVVSSAGVLETLLFCVLVLESDDSGDTMTSGCATGTF